MTARTILVTGATGFTGGYVVEELLKRPGIRVICFVRSVAKARAKALCEKPLEIRTGDFELHGSLELALRGVDTLVNVASLGFGHAAEILGACRGAGIRRALFVSTTGIYTQLNPASKALRLQAERAIQASGLEYTILRPTMIFGSPDDRNIWRLIRWLDRLPVLVVPGAGVHKVQPVYVVDLARAIVTALENDTTIGRDYNIAGRDAVSFRELVGLVGRLLGRRPMVIPFPTRPVVAALGQLERWGVRPPIKAEQILRLNEDKAFPIDAAIHDFGYDPAPLEQALRQEIGYLRGRREQI